MAYHIKYERLFECLIWQDYYLNEDETAFDQLSDARQQALLGRYDVSNDWYITPTYECRKKLEQYHLIFKKSKTGFVVGAEIEELGGGQKVPFISFDDDFRLTFELRLNNALLSLFNNLPLNQETNEVLYFSNLIGGSGGTFPLLSKPVAAFATKTDYWPGDFVIRANKQYEAIKRIVAANSNGFKQSEWNQITRRNYVNRGDLLPLSSGLYTYHFSQSNVTQATFKISSLTSAQPFEVEEQVTLESSVIPYQLDLRSFPADWYEIEVTGNNAYSDVATIYLNPPVAQDPPFAVIEIFHRTDGSLADFKLLDNGNQNQLLMPVYQLHLKNRSAIWRYIFSKEQTVSNAQLGDFLRDGNASEKNRFITKTPRPFTRWHAEPGVKKFNSDEYLPFPQVYQIRPEDKLYTEIYLID